MITVRQSIITALITRLKEILIVNGFQTDIGTTVYEWLDYAVNETVLPCINVKDTTDQIEITEVHIQRRILTVTLQVIDDCTIDEMRAYVGDIYSAMKDQYFGQYDLIIDGDIIDKEHEENVFYGGLITMNLKYATKPFDPYTEINC
jgi:hypothetical protein